MDDFKHLAKSTVFKIMDYSPGFLLKLADFGPSGIQLKSLQTSPKTVRISFSSMQGTFQGVWNDFQHSTGSSLFKTMGYSPGFLLKIGRFRAIQNSPEIFTNKPQNS